MVIWIAQNAAGGVRGVAAGDERCARNAPFGETVGRTLS